MEEDEKKEEDDEEGTVREEEKTKGERGTADYLPERRKYEQLCRGEGIKMVGKHAQIRIHTHAHVHASIHACSLSSKQSMHAFSFYTIDCQLFTI